MARIVRISTRTVGNDFGFVGVVKARNGRVIETTDAYPFPRVAERAARDLAAGRGWKVE